MNALENHLQVHGLNPVDAMNALQDAGIISDNAVAPSDVAEADCERAIKWLVQDGELF